MVFFYEYLNYPARVTFPAYLIHLEVLKQYYMAKITHYLVPHYSVKFSSASCYFLNLRSKCSSQQSALRHSQ